MFSLFTLNSFSQSVPVYVVNKMDCDVEIVAYGGACQASNHVFVEAAIDQNFSPCLISAVKAQASFVTPTGAPSGCMVVYRLTDVSGRVLQQGRISTNGTLQTEGLKSGFYLLTLDDMGVYKFIRQ